MRTFLAFLVAFALIIAAALGFLWYAHTAGMKWPEKIAETWKDVLELFIILSAAIVGLVQLALLLQQAKDNYHQSAVESWKERARRTIELDARIGSFDTDGRRQRVQAVFKPSEWHNSPIPMDVIASQLKTQPSLEEDIVFVLGQLEMVALPVCSKVADERMAFELLDETLVWWGIAFSDFMHHRNQRDEKTKRWAYLLKLAPRWKGQIQKEQGKELHYFLRGLGDMDEAARSQDSILYRTWPTVAVWFISLVLAAFIGAYLVRFVH